MKRIVLLLVVMLPVFIWAATVDMDILAEVVTLDTLTVDSAHDDYGDWERACSVSAVSGLDSGHVVYEISGQVQLPRGGKFYVGFDSAAGTTDTLYGWEVIEAPKGREWSYIWVPFTFSYTEAIDSNTLSADSIHPAVVATMATYSTGQSYAVEDIIFKRYFEYKGD